MPTATELYQDIIGEYDEEDYFDEEDEESSEDQPTEPKRSDNPSPERPKPAQQIDTYLCEICDRQIRLPDRTNHENSKSHRSIAFEKRVQITQAKAAEQRDALTRASVELWKSTFSHTEILKNVFRYVDPSEMLRMRLVCSQWNNYLCDRDNWSPLFALHRGYELPFLDQCFLSPDFPVVNMALSFLISGTESLAKFLELGEKRQLYTVWNIRIQVNQIIHEDAQLERFFDLLQRCWAYDLRIKVAWKERDTAVDRTSAFSDFCERMFLAIAANREVQEFRCSLHSKIRSNVNPLRLLEDNVRIRLLHVGSSWFTPISRMWNLDAAEKEREKKTHRYTFENVHVKELKIVPEKTGLDGRQAKYLLRALHSNTTLHKLDMSGLSLQDPFMNAVGSLLAENQSLVELDVSAQSYSVYFNLAHLGKNTGLRSLNLSSLRLDKVTAARKHSHANTTLKELNISRCRFRVSSGHSLWEALPCNLSHLEMRSMPNSAEQPFSESFLEDLPTHLPSLEYLDISSNTFTKLAAVEKMLYEAPRLSTLLVFENSTFKDRLEFWALYYFETHPALRTCDHRKVKDKRLTGPMLDDIDGWMASRTPRTHLTKAAH